MINSYAKPPEYVDIDTSTSWENRVMYGGLCQQMRVSQLERISLFLTDSLRKIKETLGQFLTGLPTWHFLRKNQNVINSQFFIKY